MRIVMADAAYLMRDFCLPQSEDRHGGTDLADARVDLNDKEYQWQQISRVRM
jgi:hypothetical protein